MPVRMPVPVLLELLDCSIAGVMATDFFQRGVGLEECSGAYVRPPLAVYIVNTGGVPLVESCLKGRLLKEQN